jgi:hypothetical protein
VAAFFTIFFPLMLLFLFAVLFGNETVDLGDRGVFTIAQFYAPALGVFAAASATYTNIGVGTAIHRDDGILKRFRGTPLPPWIYLAGKVGSGIWVAAIAVTIMLGVGNLVFDVPVFADRLPAAVTTFVIGAAAFAALGLMLAAFAPSGDSAPAIANATILPMAFVSDVFIIVSRPAPVAGHRSVTSCRSSTSYEPSRHRSARRSPTPASGGAISPSSPLGVSARPWRRCATSAGIRRSAVSGRAPRRSGSGRTDAGA